MGGVVKGGASKAIYYVASFLGSPLGGAWESLGTIEANYYAHEQHGSREATSSPTHLRCKEGVAEDRHGLF